MEREFEGNNKRVVDQGQNGSLGEDVGDLTRSARYVGFADRLECVDTLRVLLADLHDFPKGTFPNHLEEIERVDRESFMPSRLISDGEME